jgi:hypothetical protein
MMLACIFFRNYDFLLEIDIGMRLQGQQVFKFWRHDLE